MEREFVSLCRSEAYDFDGFTVQCGMIFGRSRTGNLFVSNGTLHRDFFNAYILIGGEWMQNKVFENDNGGIFKLIQKCVKYRVRKGIDGVSYLTPDQLETVRWASDPQHRHFQSHNPLAQPKSVSIPNPHQAAKFNGIKERGMMEQRLQICIYNTVAGATII